MYLKLFKRVLGQLGRHGAEIAVLAEDVG